ncbi:MAG: beta-lactamase family protein [Bacteroidetes bacterium]|nr:beta-lactamase family protein [Bacteroidota bacterium]MBU1577815.1 beta-lactamase family protein [Bacteroidota bacterium]MBU2558637.1 beta-lactamase family protein [Bacteroidota bacterium]
MKKLQLTILFVSLLLLGATTSCKKEESPDQHQPLIDQMKAVADSIVDNTHVPGIVALVVDHKRGIDWLYTTGVSDIPNQLPMDGSYTFRMGSNTKTMTGTVLLQLVEEGKIALNDKLSQYFPAYPKADSITIAMLCNMTSGVFNYSEDEAWLAELVSNPSKAWTVQETVDIGFSRDFYFSPGTGFHYSNTNTFLIGMLIEKLTGNSLKTEIENRIINPLQLSNTGFLTSGLDLPGTHGRGYYSGEYSENEDVTEHFDISWAWAAGSAYTTPRELQHYVETLVGGGFLSDTLQQQRLSDFHMVSPTTGYGLCILKRGSFFGHNGGLPGFTSSMYHSNEKDCTVIIYFNSQLELIPDYLFLRFMNIMYGNDF